MFDKEDDKLSQLKDNYGKRVRLYLKQADKVVEGTLDGCVDNIVLLKNAKVKRSGYTVNNSHVLEEEIDKFEFMEE